MVSCIFMLSKNDSPSCSASLARSAVVWVSVAGRSVLFPRALRAWDDILILKPGSVFRFSLEAEARADVEDDVGASGKSESGVSLAVCTDVEGGVEFGASGKSESGILAVCADGGVWASGKSGVVGAVAGVDRDFEDFLPVDFLPVGRAIMRSSRFS